MKKIGSFFGICEIFGGKIKKWNLVFLECLREMKKKLEFGICRENVLE